MLTSISAAQAAPTAAETAAAAPEEAPAAEPPHEEAPEVQATAKEEPQPAAAKESAPGAAQTDAEAVVDKATDAGVSRTHAGHLQPTLCNPTAWHWRTDLLGNVTPSAACRKVDWCPPSCQAVAVLWVQREHLTHRMLSTTSLCSGRRTPS